MATKSPGVYFHEIDNTQFTNPKAITGTTLAIVGYAKKGPIGVPVLLNSWSDFVNTFGRPVEGFYSGLAVHTFISAKGAVLFTRVADEAIAKPSVFVMKNGLPAVDGYIRFANGKTTINNSVYRQGAHYCFKVAREDGGKYKYFFVDTPDTVMDKATLTSIIANQLKATPAKWEAQVAKVPGLYAFNVETNGELASGEDGGYFINISPVEEKSTIVEHLKQRLEEGTNSIAEVIIANEPTYSATPSALPEEGTYDGIKGKNKKFKLIKNGIAFDISVNMEGDMTLKNIAKILNDELNNDSYGVNVFAVQGKDRSSWSKLMFVSKKTSDKIAIASYTKKGSAVSKEDLFALQNNTPMENDKDGNFVVNTDAVREVYLNVVNQNKEEGKPGKELEFVINKYDDKKGTFVLTSKDTGDEKTVKFVDYAKYTSTNPELSLFTSSDPENRRDGVFGKIYSVDGQAELENVTVTRDIELSGDDKIRFTALGSIAAPSIKSIGEEDEFIGGKNTVFEDFLPIMKDPDSNSDSGLDTPVIGRKEVDDSAKDIVVFTSREVGSGTNNIDIEVWSRTDFSGKNKSYGIDIYVDGIKKQTYEDISLKYAIKDTDEKKRFDLVINETPENGGSPYIKVEIIRGDPEDQNVQIKEGRFHIGKANRSIDVEKTTSIPDGAYKAYDYAIGNDGIPEGSGSYLFEEAMRPGTSALANKELYDFHILICPDNITQEVQTAQIKLCEDREDAITIIDPPVGLNKKAVIDWHNGRGHGRNVAIESNYAATYWPWCKVVDTTNGVGRYTWVMPSIIMAAQYVKVDKSVGAHMAPAGEVNGRLGVIDIEKYPNQLDRDELYVDYNRVNPITKFKDGSIVAYGEKTTQRTNSVLTKIHTRRMLVQIKKECREALRGYIFMPNTGSYLGKIKNNITGILDYYKKKGGINFFKVICDESNNPVELRQQDIINVDAIIVPEGTIEQINISLTLNKSAETVTD